MKKTDFSQMGLEKKQLLSLNINKAKPSEVLETPEGFFY